MLRKNAATMTLALMFVICCGLASFLNFVSETESAIVAAEPANQAPASPRKIALLVGISTYERQPEKRQPPDWWNLSSHSDIEALKKVLLFNFAFQPGDVLILEDHEATRDGIIEAFENHLIAKAKPGDIVYFHYSGHGQQVLDDNGDEFDGLDETFVTANYVEQSAESGAKTNLRDDTVGELLQKLQAKMVVNGRLQGSITVTLDSCFSGTATRGIPEEGRLTKRGRGWLVGMDGPLPLPLAGGAVDQGSGLLAPGEAVKQEYVLLTASSSDQLSNEWPSPDGGDMGAFTRFLVQELKNANPKTTYRSIFEKVNAEVSSRIHDQNPQLEGMADTLLFSGTAVPRDQYDVVTGVDGDTLTFPLGAVRGVAKGSIFQIYPPSANVKDPSQRIAEAEITDVRGTSSQALLTEPYRGKLKKELLLAGRAVETNRAYGDNVLKLYVEPGAPAAIAEFASRLKMVTIHGATSNNFDLRVRKKEKLPKEKYKGEQEFVLEQPAAVIFRIDPASTDLEAKFRSSIQNEYRSRFLMRLNNPDDDPLIKVDLRLVPVKVELDSRKRITKVTIREDVAEDETGRTTVQLTDGDYVMPQVRNRSENLPAYITVIHFPQDRSVYCLFPELEDDKFAADGKWVSLGIRFVFQAEALRDSEGTLLPTSVLETFKAIATMEPSNYRDLLPSRTSIERGSSHVRGTVKANPSRPRGQNATPYDLGRLLGTVMIGEDPDPNNIHSRTRSIPTIVTDWNTADVKVETRPKK